MTPLHWPAKYGDTEAETLLIQNGAEIQANDLDGRTPAIVAKVECTN